MIMNLDQAIKHNAKFYNAFVDLKVTGWKSYSSALNDYTFNFYKKQLEETNGIVEQFGDAIKIEES